MTQKDLTLKLGRVLIKRRDALRRALDSQRRQAWERDRIVGDIGDAAVDSEQGELDSQLASVENRELVAIEEALDRIRDGSYGICSGCEKRIPIARLRALPYAELCIACQRETECRATRPYPVDDRATMPWDVAVHESAAS